MSVSTTARTRHAEERTRVYTIIREDYLATQAKFGVQAKNTILTGRSSIKNFMVRIVGPKELDAVQDRVSEFVPSEPETVEIDARLCIHVDFTCVYSLGRRLWLQ